MTIEGGVLVGDDYVDTDVAYLLGMLFGRGQLIEERNSRRLIITLDIRRTLPKLPPGVQLDMDLDLENERALNVVRRRINDLLDANVDVAPIKKGTTTLTAVFVKPTIAWRDLKLLCSNGTDRSNFQLPQSFFALPVSLQKEFLRGFGDVAVMPSYADRDQAKRVRIAFPVVHGNSTFAKQLVKIFKKIDIDAKLLAGTAKKRGSKKEHRVRVYAEDYETVGFGFSHKQRLMKLLAEYNRSL